MICAYLELDSETFIHNRQNGEKTIAYQIDPILVLIPTPKKGQIIENMTKELAVMLLEWLFPAAVEKIKDNKETVKIPRNEFQALYHYVIEDYLLMEHNIDFEDFIQTVMFHKIIKDDTDELAVMIVEAETDLLRFFEDSFIDSD